MFIQCILNLHRKKIGIADGFVPGSFGAKTMLLGEAFMCFRQNI